MSTICAVRIDKTFEQETKKNVRLLCQGMVGSTVGKQLFSSNKNSEHFVFIVICYRIYDKKKLKNFGYYLCHLCLMLKLTSLSHYIGLILPIRYNCVHPKIPYLSSMLPEPNEMCFACGLKPLSLLWRLYFETIWHY